VPYSSRGQLTDQSIKGSEQHMDEKLGIAGSGAIATGLAVAGSVVGDVVLVARSEASADRARATVEKVCGKV
jgi:3-hydroxybutyryl-CoA dehydrogenase